MAPRRVAAALASDDTLEDSIRQDILGEGADDQGDDQERQPARRVQARQPEPGDEQQDDQGDDDQQQDDQGDDDQQQDDQGDDDQQEQPRQQRRSARQERDEDYISPAAQARIDEANRIATETAARLSVFEQTYGQTRESPEQEAARLALMTLDQQVDYKLQKALGSYQRTTAQQTFNATNSADEASFNAMIANNPQLKRFSADVTRKHAELVRQNGGLNGPRRQDVLTYLLGQRALELAQQAAPQQRQRQRRVDRQQVRPGSARSDVQPSRRQAQTAEQRLENVQI